MRQTRELNLKYSLYRRVCPYSKTASRASRESRQFFLPCSPSISLDKNARRTLYARHEHTVSLYRHCCARCYVRNICAKKRANAVSAVVGRKLQTPIALVPAAHQLAPLLARKNTRRVDNEGDYSWVLSRVAAAYLAPDFKNCRNIYAKTGKI